MNVEVIIVTLTHHTLDTVKLVFLDVSTSIRPGFNDDTYSMWKDEFYGCVTIAKLSMKCSSVKEAFDKIKASLKKRGVEYMMLRVQSMDDPTVASCVCPGTVPVSPVVGPSQGPYRSPA